MFYIIFLFIDALKYSVYLTLNAYHNSVTKFSSEILELCLDFMQFYR